MKSYKFLRGAIKLIKPINRLVNSIKKLIPKSKSEKQFDELRNEILSLKRELESSKKNISRKSQKIIKKKEDLQNRDEYMQGELYIGVVTSGQTGSESGGYILINLPNSEFEKEKHDFFNMPTYKIKNLLGLPKEKIVKNIDKGETISNIRERFLEINGKREKFVRLW